MKEPTRILPFLLLVAAIVTLTGVGMVQTLIIHKSIESARLQAVADLKTRQIADWLRERQGEADFVQTSDFFAEQYRRWQESGDLYGIERMQARLEQLHKNLGFSAVTLLDPQGKRLWGSGKAPPAVTPNVLAAAELSTTDRTVRRVDPYRDATGNQRLDFVVPLTAVPGPAPLIILHIDLTDWLFPALQTWPVPSASGETLLFRRDGDQVLYLNELRHQQDAAAKLRLPTSAQNLLAAQALRGEVPLGIPVEGVDYRGIPAIGVVRAIVGTDWFLLAKLDRAELYDEAEQNVIWIGLAGLLALSMAGAGFFLLRQRQQLALAHAVQQSQAEHLHTLHLLADIADSSDDAIFAKDLMGRFILFNRAASHFVGKPVEDVLGRDDRAIFPPDQAERLMAIDRQVIAENRIQTQEETLSTADGERVFLATKGPLRDAEGKVIGLFGISRDITGRKQAEAALQASELSYRSLFENMMNGYAHCLMLFEDGEPRDFVYLHVNKAFEAQTGLRDVVGHKVSEVIPSIRETDPDLLKIYGRVAASGLSEHFEIYVEALRMWFAISVYSPQREHFVTVFDVITERKQAENVLRESERRFRQLFDLAPVPMGIVNQDGVVVAVNNRFVDVFGYTPADVPTLAEWWQLSYPDPDYRRWVMDSWDATVQRAEDQNTDIKSIEHQVTCKNGNVRTVVIFGTHIGTELLVSFFDITERKLAEAELQLWAQSFEHANFGLAIADAGNNTLLAVNPAFASERGYSPEEMVGKPVMMVYPADRIEDIKNIINDLEVSSHGVFEMEHVRKDGRRFPVMMDVTVIKSAEGKPMTRVAYALDITAKKQAEEALLHQTEELAQRNVELERFNRAMVGRELDMIALKQQVNALSRQLGQDPPYPMAFLEDSVGQPGTGEAL